MEAVKYFRLSKNYIEDPLRVEVFKRWLEKIFKRYEAKEVGFFEQDGTNLIENKVTIVFYR